MKKQIKFVLIFVLCTTINIQAQYLNVTFCAETTEVTPVNDANGNDQRHKGAMLLDYILVKRFGGSTAPTIYQLSKEAGDPEFDTGTFVDDCKNNNINTNCNGCGTCLDPKINGSTQGTISTKFEKSVRVRGVNGNIQFESTGKFNQVCYTTKNIDLSNYKKTSLSIEVGWEGLEEDGFSAKNILIYYTFNGGTRKWLKIINSSSSVLGKQSTRLSKTTPVPDGGGNGGGCANAFNFKINDFNDQTNGLQFPVKLKSDKTGSQSYDITYKNNSYDYNCEFALPSNTEDYYFEPKYNEDSWRGLSTRDLVVIQNQLLGKKIFTKTEMKIAADVNNSGSISTKDISKIRKIILGAWIVFQKVESYRFWNAAQDFSGNNDPLLIPILEEKIPLDNVLNKSVSGDFNVVKMGDLTTLENLQGIKTRTDQTIELITENIQLKAFQTKDIYFKLNASNVKAIQALQGAFMVNNNSCTISSLEFAGLNNVFTNYMSDQDIRFLWYCDKAIQLDKMPFLKLQITSNQDIALKDAIVWNKNALEGLFTDQNIQEGLIKLKFTTDNSTIQNEILIAPNPIQNGVVSFTSLSNKEINQIKILSSNGQVVSAHSVKKIYSTEEVYNIKLDIDNVDGCYFLVIYYQDNTSAMAKFVLSN